MGECFDAQKQSCAIADSIATDITSIDGLKELWEETQGGPRICIAVLDGPVDESYPSISRANLTRIDTLVPNQASRTVSDGGYSISPGSNFRVFQYW